MFVLVVGISGSDSCFIKIELRNRVIRIYFLHGLAYRPDGDAFVFTPSNDQGVFLVNSGRIHLVSCFIRMMESNVVSILIIVPESNSFVLARSNDITVILTKLGRVHYALVLCNLFKLQPRFEAPEYEGLIGTATQNLVSFNVEINFPHFIGMAVQLYLYLSFFDVPDDGFVVG